MRAYTYQDTTAPSRTYRSHRRTRRSFVASIFDGVVVYLLLPLLVCEIATQRGYAQDLVGDRSIGVDRELLTISHASYAFIDDESTVRPSYRVSVLADGIVRFHGFGGVRTIGDAQHQLTSQQLADLLSAIRSLNLPSAPTLNGRADCVMGFCYASVSYSIDGATGNIRLGASNSEYYARLRRSLEPFLKTMDYRCPMRNSKLHIAALNIDLDYCRNVFELEGLSPVGGEK